eukprot:TRINITY_DN744_c0_g1_i1.p1 TRINITY_DN744_c0_g1~~TRINITY_DN744_c0_g1_i1.p1  ORF type:complete len:127 (+),score=37.74 TRINITY_DN744_c0_g1_i1:112-492(+)
MSSTKKGAAATADADAPAPAKTARSTTARAPKPKADKLAVFEPTQLDTLKRKRIVSLCKQAGIKANKSNDDLKEALKQYHKDNKSQIDAELKERKTKRRKKDHPKNTMLKGLETSIHYDAPRTVID